MTFEADLKSHLGADSSITALVSDRISPLLLKDGSSLPAITYQAISGEPQTDLSGGDGDMVRYRMQLNVWADSYLGAKALAELVRTRLKTAATNFKAVPNGSAQDVYEAQTKRFGVYMDFSFWYRTT